MGLHLKFVILAIVREVEVLVCSRHFSDVCYTGINNGYNAEFADHLKLTDGAIPALKDAHAASETRSNVCVSAIGTYVNFVHNRNLDK